MKIFKRRKPAPAPELIYLPIYLNKQAARRALEDGATQGLTREVIRQLEPDHFPTGSINTIGACIVSVPTDTPFPDFEVDGRQVKWR